MPTGKMSDHTNVLATHRQMPLDCRLEKLVETELHEFVIQEGV